MAHSEATASCCVLLSRLGKGRQGPIKGIQSPERRERPGLGLLVRSHSCCRLTALTTAMGRLKFYDPDRVAPASVPFVEQVTYANLFANGVAVNLLASSWR